MIIKEIKEGILSLKESYITFDDFTENEKGLENSHWTQVCEDCRNKYNFPFSDLDDVGYGICGVLGCQNEADFYLELNLED